jgi:hypothetical protein
MNSTVKYSYITSMLLTIIGALMKINHVPFSNVFLAIGLIALLIFIIYAIIEVNRSKKISDSEKFMWNVGFIFFGSITGLIYIFSARKRIV